MATRPAPFIASTLAKLSPALGRAEGASVGQRPSLGLAERQLVRRSGDVLSVAAPWLVPALAGVALDLTSALTAVVCWLLASAMLDTYHPNRGARLPLLLTSALGTLALASVLFVGLLALATPLGLPVAAQPATLTGYARDLALAAGLLAFWQAAYRQVVQQPAWRRRAVILGYNTTARITARTLRQALARDYLVVGFVADDAPRARARVVDGVPMLGDTKELVDLVRRHRVNQVLLAADDRLSAESVELLAEAREQGVEIVPLAELYRRISGRLPLDDGPAFRLAALTDTRDRALVLYGLAKRLMDLASAVVGLAVLVLLVPFVALANAIESPGPLFYSQVRVGQGGRTFRMYKLRSMIVDAEPAGQPQWSRPNDRRVTRIGRLLRRTHLDEVPQFWNVLRGEMSLVGPRPERPELVLELQRQIPCYSARHAVRPGLTGWAQVNYPYGNSVRDARIKLEYDLYYLQHRSLWLDILCLLRTARVLVSMPGI